MTSTSPASPTSLSQQDAPQPITNKKTSKTNNNNNSNQSNSHIKSKSALALEIEKAQKAKDEAPVNTPLAIAFKILKYLVLLTVIVILILAVANGETTLKILEDFVSWMENNLFIGIICYILLYSALHLFAIPGITLTIAIGFVFGRLDIPTWLALIIASFIAWFAASAGCTLAFLNGRYVMRSLVLSWIVYCIPDKNSKKSKKSSNAAGGDDEAAKKPGKSIHELAGGDNAPRLERRNSLSISTTAAEIGSDIILILEHIVQTKGALVVILLRSNLILPYNIINYGMAITDVSFKRYLIGNLGVIPDSVIYAFVGLSVSTLTDIENSKVSDNEELYIIFITVAVISFSLLLGLILYATKSVKKMIADAQEEQAKANQLSKMADGPGADEYDIEPIDPKNRDVPLTIESDRE